MVALKESCSAIAPPPGLELFATDVGRHPSTPPGFHGPLPEDSCMPTSIADMVLRNVRLARENDELRRICAMRLAKKAALRANASVFVPGAGSFAQDETSGPWLWCGTLPALVLEKASTASPWTTQPPSDVEDDACDGSDLVVLSDSEDKTMVTPCGESPRSTMMLRNLPLHFNTKSLVELLEAEGFLGDCDFCYLPVHFETGKARAFFDGAFVNVVSIEAKKRFLQHFSGFTSPAADQGKIGCPKPLEVQTTSGTQGLQANIDKFRNSPVMHDSVPSEFKPVVFVDGKVADFPLPTKEVRAPRMRPRA